VRSPLSALDGDALAYFEYFAELIDEWAQEADPNETLFRLGASMTEAIAQGVPIEPLTCGRVAYFERERRDLVRLNYVEPTRSPLAAADGEALGYAGYFAELIDQWAQEADPNETLFRLRSSIVDAIALGVPIDPLARYFEYWLLRLQGVYEPDARLSDEALTFLGAARALSPFALGGVHVSRGALRELEAAHRGLIAMHLEKDLKSARVLREMRR